MTNPRSAVSVILFALYSSSPKFTKPEINKELDKTLALIRVDISSISKMPCLSHSGFLEIAHSNVSKNCESKPQLELTYDR